MKRYLIILCSILIIPGCYTMLNHPDIEVYYEREDSEESLSEHYDVYVDEDCANCHTDFVIQSHFSPLLPAHQSLAKWNNLPWWFDNKYLFIFENNQSDGVSSSDTYQHVQSRGNSFINTPQSGGYLPSASGGSSAGSSAASSKKAFDKTNKTKENERTEVGRQNNNNNSKSSSGFSKRKFRKRK